MWTVVAAPEVGSMCAGAFTLANANSSAVVGLVLPNLTLWGFDLVLLTYVSWGVWRAWRRGTGGGG